MNPGAYAGDLSPRQAWELLQQEGSATLVDVRTEPEWQFVGIPDLAALARRPALVSWQVYPSMQPDPAFVEKVATVAADRDAPVLFLCRSGARSRAAAMAMTAAGWQRCYNVAEGFEGDKDPQGHRGTVGGWKVADLPWAQG